MLATADPDSIAPAAIGDLAAVLPGSTTMGLAWTATGDDSAGRLPAWIVRHSSTVSRNTQVPACDARMAMPFSNKASQTEVPGAASIWSPCGQYSAWGRILMTGMEWAG